MPRIIKASRAAFIQQQEQKAKTRLPKRLGIKQKSGTLFAIRNKRLAIREAAMRKVQIVLTYRKTHTNEIKKYIVSPYSFRYLRLKSGLRKVLYAYDMNERTIKSFVLNNIRNVALTDRKYKPMWPVEF